MQGVLIASASSAVQEALAAILQGGRMVQKAGTVADALSIAAAQRLDYIFVDDVYEDGTGEDLVRRLHTLGYGIELIPMLLSTENLYMKPFVPFGVKHAVAKPFDVEQIENVIQHIEELANLQEIPFKSRQSQSSMSINEEGGGIKESRPEWYGGEDVDVREISQRLKRIISKLSNRDDLIKAFADSLREQFDVDNAVVLLPDGKSLAFRITLGYVTPEVREQFAIPLDEPLVASLTRLEEPVWVHDCERLGRQNAIAATRYGERLRVEVLCPVLSRGRLIALVGLSRFHRYENSPALISLLRLFLTFFSEALDNTQIYERMSETGETFRNMVDAAPHGAVAVSGNGRIIHLNPEAIRLLGSSDAELVNQSVERAGSLIADAAWRAIRTGKKTAGRVIRLMDSQAKVTAAPLDLSENNSGALVWLQDHSVSSAENKDESSAGDDVLAAMPAWNNVARVIAHNFKNALVPVKTCAELLPERYQSKAFRQSFFNIVQDNIKQLDTWITELLRYAQMPDAADSWETISLHICVQDAVEKMQTIRPGIKSALEFDVDETAVICGNNEFLTKALQELLKNAWDAVQDIAKPRIRLKTQKDKDEAIVSIADNGSGLSDIDRETALLPFATNKLSGLGLGLAYVQKIARLHRGNVELSSGSQGTSITLRFPLAKEAPVKNAEVTVAGLETK